MRFWTIVGITGLVVGAALGVGLYTFAYAKGASYMTNDPGACANCHIMQDHFDGWLHSSHRSVAVCNDCHTPIGMIPKYATKASNGFWHSFAFTTGRFPDPLRIKEHNRRITEHACRKCHQGIVQAIDHHAGESVGSESLACVRCHRTVGHDF
jgi:cytochrome c nitrite reductase small subunit